jgi:hypothetical protein
MDGARVEADGQRPVQVSVGLDPDRHKLVPGHLSHRPELSKLPPGSVARANALHEN